MIKLCRLFMTMFSMFLFLFYVVSSHAQDKINLPEKVKTSLSDQTFKKQNKKQKKEVFSEKKKRVKGYTKYDQPDMFAEFQKIIRTRDGEAAPKYTANYLMEELDKAQKQKRFYKTNALNWIERGPGNVSGRTRGIIVDPSDSTHKTWFAGSVGGGIWKTTDAGGTWANKTPNLPNLATTVLAQAPSNPDIIYCGTGEGFFNADAVNGAGIFKSTDHGETWTQLDSTANFNFRNVNRIIVDPNNPETVLTCTNPGPDYFTNPGGIHRSTNGGATWTRVKDFGSMRAQDLKSDPSNFSIQYCAVNNDGIYKSTDAGLTWTKSSNELVTNGRIEIAVSSKNTNYVYASCEESDDKSGLYVSDNKGATWFLVNSPDGNEQNWLQTQGWYDNTIAVHPYDEKIVFFGGIDIWKARIDSTSSPRLATFSHVTDGYRQYGKPYVHVDHHSIVIVPVSSPGTFWIVNGNDGGVAFSTNSGTTWNGNSTTNNSNNGGYNTTQFYGVDKKPGGNEYIGGTQDNGTWLSPRNPLITTAYSLVIGGDGFDAVWHHKDSDKIIGGSQYNNFYRTTDGGSNWISAIKGLDDAGDGKGCFISKIAESNSDPDIIFTTGSQGIWRSEDFGASWIKSVITTNDWSYNSTSTPVTISIADPQVVWAGNRFTNSESRLFLSTDGGITFASVAKPTGVVALGSITGIDTHPTDINTVFITYSISGAPKILRTPDLGNSWQDISGFGTNSTSSTGFPNVATYCVAVMPYDANIIWAGTEIGLFESTDNGDTWHPADNGLPSVSIWDMKIVDDQVILATHGRGIWSVSLPQLSGDPLPYPPPVVTLSPIITALSQGLDKAINIIANLRSTYDSTLVMIDGQKTSKLTATTAGERTFKFFTAKIGKVNIQLISYRSGKFYKSSLRSLDLYDLKATQVVYSNSFDVDNGDFVGNGFTISTPSGFNSPMVNSPHPYSELTDYYYNLLVPIKISDLTNPTNIEYDDIALVEPGEFNAVFGDEEFWDYVVVEGSKDGLNWIPFEDGYDCRYNSSWANLYPSGNPTPSDYVHHKIDMTQKFNRGDTIFIRFHLYSDPYAVGWGWAFDNLKIQDGATDVEIENTIPTEYSLSQNYPNPFNPETTIRFSLPQRSIVKLEIFDALGRVISTLVNDELDAGSYKYTWNASNFASGVYVYRITANDFSSSKKLMLVK